MYNFLKLAAAVIIFSIPLTVFAEQGDIVVGDVDLSGLGWGDQNADIVLENKTEYLKFVVSNTDLSFEGMYTNPKFRVKTVYILEPLQKITISPELFIPGNYGTVTIKLNLYDVVDTLDELMPWHKFYEQPFVIKFTPSDEIFPYLQEKVTFPPRVDVHPFFNNEFSRLLFTLLAEGKSIEEIAVLNKCDTSFINSQIAIFVEKKYLIPFENSYKTTFPYITRAEAEAGKKIADRVSDILAVLIAENLKSYFTVIDSLTKAKTFPKDSNDFISGAALWYKPTPVVSALVLWYELGRKFITRAAPLLIYNGTDICNTQNIQYMYMVDGGAFLNGSHFFGLFYGDDSYSMMFSENHLHVKCKENFQFNPIRKGGIWKYDTKILPEFFIVDTSKGRPLINLLTKGSDEILKEAYSSLMKNSTDHGHQKMYIGHRYWFWNLTSTLTLEKLFESGALNKREKDFFRFDKVKGLSRSNTH